MTSEPPIRPHPRRQLEDLLTHAVRFSVMAALADIQKAEFAAVRDSVEITDSMLSKQVSLLEAAGFVQVDKVKTGRRVRTWLSTTAAGTAAYRRHLAALVAIAGIHRRIST